MNIEQILTDVSKEKISAWQAYTKIRNEAEFLPEVEAINQRIALAKEAGSIISKAHEKAYMDYQSHIGRNRLNLTAVCNELFNEPNDYIDHKRIRLMKVLDGYTDKLSLSIAVEDKALKEKRAIVEPFVEEARLRITKINCEIKAARPKINKDCSREFSQCEIDHLEQLHHLIKRLEEGRYANKKNMIIKILKMYSRASGAIYPAQLMRNLQAFYGEQLFKIEE